MTPYRANPDKLQEIMADNSFTNMHAIEDGGKQYRWDLIPYVKKFKAREVGVDSMDGAGLRYLEKGL